MTCEEVRNRLSEHALGTLEPAGDAGVRRHLRGCAQCRRELAAIGDGLAMLAAAAHDRTPPPELRDRVLGVLAQEWRREPVVVPDRTRGRTRVWVFGAAACVALVAAVAWGLSAHGRADDALADAASYQQLLSTLGGEEFRVGALDQAGDVRIDGSVVLYDSSVEQSWGVVLVRAPELTGEVGVSLHSNDGRTIELRSVELEGGSGATWLVTAENLHAFDSLTVTAADGSTIATATIAPA